MLREIYRNKVVEIVEQTPSCRTLRMFGSTHATDFKQHYVSLPYIQFYLTSAAWGGYSYMTFSQEPLKMDGSVPTYYPLLPNVHSPTDGGHICHDKQKTYINGETAEQYVARFWSAKFQLYGSLNRWNGTALVYNGSLQSYENWEKLTRQDPNFIMKITLPQRFTPNLNGVSANEILKKAVS